MMELRTSCPMLLITSACSTPKLTISASRLVGFDTNIKACKSGALVRGFKLKTILFWRKKRDLHVEKYPVSTPTTWALEHEACSLCLVWGP